MKNNYFSKITSCLSIDNFNLNIFFASLYTLATCASIYRNDIIFSYIGVILVIFYTYAAIKLKPNLLSMLKSFLHKSKTSIEYNAIVSVSFLILSISNKMPIIAPICLFIFVFKLFNLIVLRLDEQDKKLDEINLLLTNNQKD
jgi:hypothetical protein